MSNTVISVEHLTKQYDLGVIGTGTLSRDLNRWWARVRHLPDPYTRIGQQDAFARIGESILALDDVSFTVQQGEALGIIGRNGAGKSTLLKILSRVTAPTSGVVKVRGRIGSLLEVGTGFHPELTGRENVYLNGAILGMKKAEVTRKFDEIVAFAGVEKFIDTPVKRYSSGMYVRLAFAVAAHLDPEILIVDEVLAVGDAEFQKKCLGKMGDVAGEGRTVLFVSHNMSAIESLCASSFLLQDGKIAEYGGTGSIVSKYLDTQQVKNVVHLKNRTDRIGSKGIVFEDFYITDFRGNRVVSAKSGGNYRFIMSVIINGQSVPFTNVIASIGITDSRNNSVMLLRSNFTNQNLDLSEKKMHKIVCEVEDLNLAIGNYSINIFLSSGDSEILDWVKDVIQLYVVKGDFFGTGSIGLPDVCKTLTRANWISE